MQRSTRQRAAIINAFSDAMRPLTPQEVLESAQQSVPELGIATVYRNLRAMVEEDVLELVNLPGQAALYEATGRAHHHHFQCNNCQRVFDVDQCPGDLARLAPNGFTVESHELTLYGRCSDCQPKRAAGSRAAGSRTTAAVRPAKTHTHHA